MTKKSNRSRIEQLTDEWEPKIKSAFLDAVRDITKRAELGQLIARLERGDIAGAIDAVHLDPAVFHLLEGTIADAFKAGGISQVGALPKLANPAGGEFIVRFDARNLRAEQWLREHSSTLITRIGDDQRSAIQRILMDAMIAGRTPRATAIDIVGRVNRVTGRREGGIIGLTSPQIDQLAEVRRILADPNAIRSYFIKDKMSGKWKPRYGTTPRRFDTEIMKAIEAGKGLSADSIAKVSTLHSNRMLALRGETIARTETMAALNESSLHAMNQAVESGAVNADTVTKTWHTARDRRVRDSHATQDREVVGLGKTFSNGLAYPCDPAGGASEAANCRCWMEVRIDFTASLIEEELALAGF